mmetsp:Transcript_40167/g.92925  ORF Transcript_40167/g.92925 Transcript_40167/m.92925 type:complete len:203 (+) Transcript_40167:543-1151(+)
MSMSAHKAGRVTPMTHSLVKALSVRSFLKMLRTSTRTVFSNSSWLPNHAVTQSFTISRSHIIRAPDGRTWSMLQQELLVVSKEMDRSCSSITSRERKYSRPAETIGYPAARPKTRILNVGMIITSMLSMGMVVNATWIKNMVQKIPIDNPPITVGLINRTWSEDAWLFRKAASSNKHHNLSVHDGSQMTSILSECLSRPAKL